MRHSISLKVFVLRVIAILAILSASQVIDTILYCTVDGYNHGVLVSGGFVFGFLYHKWYRESRESEE